MHHLPHGERGWWTGKMGERWVRLVVKRQMPYITSVMSSTTYYSCMLDQLTLRTTIAASGHHTPYAKHGELRPYPIRAMYVSSLWVNRTI